MSKVIQILNRKAARLGLAAIVFLVFPSLTEAAPTLERNTALETGEHQPAIGAVATEAPRVAVFDYFPYGGRTADGQYEGLFFALLDALKDETGVTLNKDLLPLARALRAAARGEVDFLISYQDAEMTPGVDFIGAFGCATELVVVRRDSDITRLSDLAQRPIAFPRGGYFAIHHAAPLAVEAVEFSNTATMLKILDLERIEGLVISNWVLEANLRQQQQREASHYSRPDIRTIALRQFRIALSISQQSAHQALVPELRAGLSRGRETGRFDRIITRYTADGASTCHAAPDQR